MDSHLDLPCSFYLPPRLCHLSLFPVSDELYYQLCKQSVDMCCCLATEGAGSNRISMWPCLCATTHGEVRTWDCACTLDLVDGVEFMSVLLVSVSATYLCCVFLFLPPHLLYIRLVSSAQPSVFFPQPISSLASLPSPEFPCSSHHLRLVSRVCT